MTGTPVTAPLVRSVMLADVPLELVKLSVVDCPTLIVVAVAVNAPMVGAGVTVTVTVRASLPALFDTVRV